MINWVDIVIVVIVVFYVLDGYHRGFLRLIWELVGIVVAFFAALRFYGGLNILIKDNLLWADVYSKPVSFFTIWFLTQFVFFIAGRYLSFYTPVALKESKANHYLGLIPAFLKSVVFISVLLILLMILPLKMNYKNAMQNSLIGGFLIAKTAETEGRFESVFKETNTSSQSLTSFNLDESSKLDFSTTEIKIDEAGEKQLLALVNMEREKAGLKPLVEDILVRNVARIQSRDMLIRGYFSHISPTGETLVSRLSSANVQYTAAAENIALAPTIELAHNGLINSPKHKANILDPTMLRVGIGILDAGQYGLMVTQDFTK